MTEALERNADSTYANAPYRRTAAYAQLGKLPEARAQAAEVLRIDPKWTITQKGVRIFTFKRTDDAAHLFDGLRKAGLPES